MGESGQARGEKIDPRMAPPRILLSLLLATLAGSAWAADTAPRTAKPPWGRIVMVGASATAGFTASEMLGGTNTPFYRLSRYIDAAIIAPHEPVENLAHRMFFLQPETTGLMQVTDAIELKPTLVIGVDFLFWFCYGDTDTSSLRLWRLERGLKILESISCPLIIGDIPDASAAVATGMLKETQVPAAGARAEANRRLKEWAATRPHVVVVPLAEFMRAAQANQPVALRGATLPEGKTRALLQDDRLHPTPPGAAVLAMAILDAFHSAQPKLATNNVRWNHQEVFRLGYKPSSPQSRSAQAGEALQPAAAKTP